jgi:DNA-directed RNA polymerase specialized sigma24 family protein
MVRATDIPAIIEALLSTITRLASVYVIDGDDLAQDLAIDILEHPRPVENPIPYYRVVLRHMAIKRSYLPSIRSLDMPVYRDCETPLGETLPAPPEAPDHTRTDRRTDVLYAALRKLPLEEQMYLREVHHLNAYNPVPVPGQRPNYDRSRHTMSQQVYPRLRNDQQLSHDILEVF